MYIHKYVFVVLEELVYVCTKQTRPSSIRIDACFLNGAVRASLSNIHRAGVATPKGSMYYSASMEVAHINDTSKGAIGINSEKQYHNFAAMELAPKNMADVVPLWEFGPNTDTSYTGFLSLHSAISSRDPLGPACDVIRAQIWAAPSCERFSEACMCLLCLLRSVSDAAVKSNSWARPVQWLVESELLAETRNPGGSN